MELIACKCLILLKHNSTNIKVYDYEFYFWNESLIIHIRVQQENAT